MTRKQDQIVSFINNSSKHASLVGLASLDMKQNGRLNLVKDATKSKVEDLLARVSTVNKNRRGKEPPGSEERMFPLSAPKYSRSVYDELIEEILTQALVLSETWRS